MLEVVIPTYGRPHSARRAIESCLAIEAEDLIVSCNSNGPDPFLESLSKEVGCSRLRYSSFEKNLGPHANFSYLIKNARAKYLMILSDEDYLDPGCAQGYLSFLRSLHDKVAVISSAIYDSISHNYYFRPHFLHGKTLGINQYLCCSEPIPSYVSGLVFRTDRLPAQLVDQCMATVSPANSYAQLDLVLGILDRGSMATFCSYKFVVKGNEARIGGDSHSHKTSSSNNYVVETRTVSESRLGENLDLNPSVYGPEARTQQFVYRATRMTKLRRISRVVRNIGLANLLVVFSEAVLYSPRAVRLPENFKLSDSVSHSIQNLPLCSDCPSAWIHFFDAIILYNRPFGRVALKNLRLVLLLLRRATLAFS
ncbi:glycosyl transferase 2 family protein [Synechococcus sp. WH 8103]|nr:glycosyl transferase 2 family protein [Synechococcus sp. WH 8103]